MKNLRVVVPNLTAVTMGTVFAEAAALGDGPSDGGPEELRLILEDVKFIDPYGLVGLWCVLRYLKRRHQAVVVIPPTDRELQDYLRRMNFPAVTSHIAGLDGGVGGRGGSSQRTGKAEGPRLCPGGSLWTACLLVAPAALPYRGEVFAEAGAQHRERGGPGGVRPLASCTPAAVSPRSCPASAF